MNTATGFLESLKKLKRNVAEALVKSGACDCYGLSRSNLLKLIYTLAGRSEHDSIEEFSQYKSLTPRELKYVMSYLEKEKIQMSLFPELAKERSNPIYIVRSALREMVDEEYVNVKRRSLIQAKIAYLEKDSQDTNRQKSIWESLYLGLNLTCSAADDFAKKDKSVISCRQVYSVPPKAKVALHVVIDAIKVKKTSEKSKRPGQEFCYLNVSDNTGALSSVVCWSDQYMDFKDQIYESAVVFIKGRKDVWRNREQIVVESIELIG